MDYTLLHYNVQAWEQRVFHYAKDNLKAAGLFIEPDSWKRSLSAPARAVDVRYVGGGL